MLHPQEEPPLINLTSGAETKASRESIRSPNRD
jgi:hypothetical protein